VELLANTGIDDPEAWAKPAALGARRGGVDGGGVDRDRHETAPVSASQDLSASSFVSMLRLVTSTPTDDLKARHSSPALIAESTKTAETSRACLRREVIARAGGG